MIRSFVEASSFLATVSIVNSWIVLKDEFHDSLLKKSEKLNKQARSLIAEYRQIQEKVKNNYWDEIYRSKFLQLKSGKKINQEDMEEFVLNIIGDEVITEMEYSDSNSWSRLVSIIEDRDENDLVSDEFRLIPSLDLDSANDSVSSYTNLPLLPFLLNVTAQNEIDYDNYTTNFTLQLGRVINLIRNVAMSDAIGPDFAFSTIQLQFLFSLGVYAIQIPLLNRFWPTASFLPNTTLFRQFIPSFKSAGYSRGNMLKIFLTTLFAPLGLWYYLNNKDDDKSDVIPIPTALIFGSSGSSKGIPVVYPGATKDDPLTYHRLYIYLMATPVFENALLLGTLFPRLLYFGGGVVAYPLTALVSLMMTHVGAQTFDARTTILNLTRNESNLVTVTFTLVLARFYHLTGKPFVPIFLHTLFNFAMLKVEFDSREDISLERLNAWNAYLSYRLISVRFNHMLDFVVTKLRYFGYFPLPPSIASATGEPSKELKSIAEKAVRMFTTHSVKGGAGGAVLNHEDFADFMIAFEYAVKHSSSGTASSFKSEDSVPSSSSSDPSCHLRSCQSLLPERNKIRENRQLLTELRSYRIIQINEQKGVGVGVGQQKEQSGIDLKVTDLLHKNDSETLHHMFLHDLHLRHGRQSYPRGVTADQLARRMLVRLASLNSRSLRSLNVQQLHNELFYWYRMPTGALGASSSSGGGGGGGQLTGAREDFLDLIQEYYTRILEVDQFAAAEIVRVQGAVWTASLAGRRPAAEDTSRYNSAAQAARRLALRREAFSVLADYGLTPRRFGLLLKDQVPRYQAVQELNQQWMQYFDTLDYKRKWLALAYPIPGAKLVTDKDLK